MPAYDIPNKREKKVERAAKETELANNLVRPLGTLPDLRRPVAVEPIPQYFFATTSVPVAFTHEHDSRPRRSYCRPYVPRFALQSLT
jgi:hypothetical protein